MYFIQDLERIDKNLRIGVIILDSWCILLFYGPPHSRDFPYCRENQHSASCRSNRPSKRNESQMQRLGENRREFAPNPKPSSGQKQAYDQLGEVLMLGLYIPSGYD